MNRVVQGVQRKGGLIAVALLLFIGVWNQRWIFFDRYDASLSEREFSFSQWSIPLSPRVMGDAELYSFAGYRYVHSDYTPFSIAPEVPPLGKILFGWSIRVWQSPYWINAGVFLLLFWALLLVARALQFTRSEMITLSLVWLLQPLVWQQLGSTMLDSQVVFWMLLQTLALWKAQSASGVIRLVWLVASGVFLGAGMATKIAVFTPIFILLSACFCSQHESKTAVLQARRTALISNRSSIVLRSMRRIAALDWKRGLLASMTIAISAALTYFVVYLPWILQSGSLLEWVSGQKWMVSFYLNSDIEPIPGMVVITWFTGLFRGWWGAGWQLSEVWSPLWLLVLPALFGWWRLRFQVGVVPTRWRYVAFVFFALCAVCIPIPFWPRFLLLLSP